MHGFAEQTGGPAPSPRIPGTPQRRSQRQRRAIFYTWSILTQKNFEPQNAQLVRT